MNRQAAKQQSAVTVAAAFADCLEQLEAAPQVLVGFSGGLDSAVLLHLLSEALPPERITAVHIHHGLSANAGDWQQHAKQVCQGLGVRLIAESVSIDASGAGIESAARDARYAVCEKH